MRWRDVNYLCHGLEAEVIADDYESPSGEVALRRFHGTIHCPQHDSVPLLKSGNRLQAFYSAVVLLVPSPAPRKKRT